MSTDSLPVINIADLERADTRRAIETACRDWGFFQVVGHGIDEHLMAALRRQMRSFFAQPLTVKREILRTADNPWGFYDRELTKHTPDWKQVYDYGPSDGCVIEAQWPEGASSRVVIGGEAGLVLSGVGLVGRVAYGSNANINGRASVTYGGSVHFGKLQGDYAYDPGSLSGDNGHHIGVRLEPNELVDFDLTNSRIEVIREPVLIPED